MNKSYSHEKQDLFVESLLPISKGFFLDVACGNAIVGSNTYLLESEYQWTGLGFDLHQPFQEPWLKSRSSKFFLADATSIDFVNILKSEVKDGMIDYLSLDVDVGGYREANLSHLVLPRILEAGISFKCATIEHESFKYGPQGRDSMRKVLLDLGYKMLFEGVKFPNGQEFEDWWIDPRYFSQEVIAKASSGVTYEEAISILKK